MDQENLATSSARHSAEPAADAQDVRCCCGSLLAKLVDGGVELKCRRCKRIIVVPFDPEDAKDDIRIGAKGQ